MVELPQKMTQSQKAKLFEVFFGKQSKGKKGSYADFVARKEAEAVSRHEAVMSWENADGEVIDTPCIAIKDAKGTLYVYTRGGSRLVRPYGEVVLGKELAVKSGITKIQA